MTSIDFTKVPIHVIIIEMDHSSNLDLEIVANELTKAGFTSAGFVMGVEIWVNKNNAAETSGVYVQAKESVRPLPPIRLLPCRGLEDHEERWLSSRDENSETTNFKPHASRLTNCP